MEHLLLTSFILCTILNRLVTSRKALVLLADDGGFESSVYGNRIVPTPGLEKLAKRGLVFDNAFTVVSSCSSSRATLMTGLPPHQNGIIGKKHVGPEHVFPFDYSKTEADFSLMQIGRNITFMLQFFRDFLLFIGFHDTHRCTPPGKYGPFCEDFGSGKPGMGAIKDWTPTFFHPNNVTVPYFLQDTSPARADLAAMYTSVTRIDRGIEMMLDELERRRLLNETLIFYTSDNGIPFPSAKTTLYDPGMREPMILSNPDETHSFGKRTSVLASTLDLMPTLLEWFRISFPSYHLFKKHPVRLTGKSLLPVTESFLNPVRQHLRQNKSVIFASQSFHGIVMSYPMRVARSHRYKLIHNLNNRSPFPIASDLYLAPSYQDIMNHTAQHSPTGWYKSIHAYYYRAEFELYDIIDDVEELKNLAGDQRFQPVFRQLAILLHNWMNETGDPWLCAPHAVLEYEPPAIAQPGCYPLYNDLD